MRQRSPKSIKTRISRHLLGPPRERLLRMLPRNAVCAEIGVWKGGFSEQILRIANPRELHLVDPWTFQPKFANRMYGGSVAKSSEDMELIFQGVVDRFKHKENVTIHRGYSDEVLRGFPDKYFDWVYVDGNHYYDYVIEDLRLSYTKIKPGGLLCGDDYLWEQDGIYHIRDAVADFVQEQGLRRPKVIDQQFVVRC